MTPETSDPGNAIANDGSGRLTAAILCAFTLAIAWVYTLPAPYFLDSFGYVLWIEEWNRSGEIPSYYRYANTLLYYLPVTVFGEIGLKVVGVGFTGALAAAYYLMIRRDFSPKAALAASILLLSAPPTVITATHLKEDLTSLLFFSVGILLVSHKAGTLRMLCVGAAYGFALLFKEIMLGAAPFLIAYTHLRGEGLRSYRDCLGWRALGPTTLRVLAIVAGALVTMLIVSPSRFADYTTMASSPYMGQFYGLFSFQQPQGLRFWAEALLYLHPWYLLPLSFYLATSSDRPPQHALYLVMALVLTFFLANVSVIRMRHYTPVFFFLAPILFEGTRSMLDMTAEILRVRSWHAGRSSNIALAGCAILAFAHLSYVYPTIDYRLRYDTSRGFYGALARVLPADALLLGMDNCPIATYESGLSCKNRPPDLDPKSAREYADVIAETSAEQPVYLLPDSFDYDARGRVRQAFASRFAIETVYTGWWEPYHVMTYGLSVDHTIERQSARWPGCTLAEKTAARARVSDDLVLDEIGLRFQCRNGSERQLVIVANKGHRAHLVRRSVSIVTPK